MYIVFIKATRKRKLSQGSQKKNFKKPLTKFLKIVKLKQAGIALNHSLLPVSQFVEISSQLDLKNVILAKIHLILNAHLTVLKTKLMKLE